MRAAFCHLFLPQDPSEHLPFLEELRTLPEPLRKFRIDLHIERFERALSHVLPSSGEFAFALLGRPGERSLPPSRPRSCRSAGGSPAGGEAAESVRRRAQFVPAGTAGVSGVQSKCPFEFSRRFLGPPPPLRPFRPSRAPSRSICAPTTASRTPDECSFAAGTSRRRRAAFWALPTGACGRQP